MSAIPVSVGQEEVALFYIMATQMVQMIRLSSKYRNDLFSLAMLSMEKDFIVRIQHLFSYISLIFQGR